MYQNDWFFFKPHLAKKDLTRTVILYKRNAYSSCSFNTLDNNLSPRMNLNYPSKDEGIIFFGLVVVSFISSVNIMNTIQDIGIKNVHKT